MVTIYVTCLLIYASDFVNSVEELLQFMFDVIAAAVSEISIYVC